MKRVRRVLARSENGEVHITIQVRLTAGVTTWEVEKAIASLADDAMRSITAVRYFSVPLSKIVVE